MVRNKCSMTLAREMVIVILGGVSIAVAIAVIMKVMEVPLHLATNHFQQITFKVYIPCIHFFVIPNPKT